MGEAAWPSSLFVSLEWPCISPGQYSRADPNDIGMSERAPKCTRTGAVLESHRLLHLGEWTMHLTEQKSVGSSGGVGGCR